MNRHRLKEAMEGVSYDRVSDKGQAFGDDGAIRSDGSNEAQRTRCDYYLSHLYHKTGIRHVLIDRISDLAVSGKNTNRAGYQRLWKLIEDEKIDFVIAADLSRISRSVSDFLAFVAHCEKHGVSIFIVGLDLDTSAPFGRMMVVVLVALAQFEREMTAVRVRENARARLLKHGKINGAGTLLGLDRDPDRKGHFVANPEGLRQVEILLNIFVTSSSRTKVLDEAKRLGIAGIGGSELTDYMLEQILFNTKWRYRGLWFDSYGGNQDVQEPIPLPHGPLINIDLLDEVQRILADPSRRNKRAGKGEHVYLLSHLLIYEDGTRFTGASAKGGAYRYYYNTVHKARIHCDQLDAMVIEKLKQQLLDSPRFIELVGEAVRSRNDQLPELRSEVKACEKDLASIERSLAKLRKRLEESGNTGKEADLWMDEIEICHRKKAHKTKELALLKRRCEETMKLSGLLDLKHTAYELLNSVEHQPGLVRRSFIESLINRIVIGFDNTISIEFVGDP